MKIIPNNVGTYPLEQREEILDLLRQTARKYGVSLWCRGRGGSRKLEKRWFVDWIEGRKPFWCSSYTHHTPLSEAKSFALYIRVRLTEKFLDKHFLYKDYKGGPTIGDFENLVVPIIRDEMLEILKENNYKSIKN